MHTLSSCPCAIKTWYVIHLAIERSLNDFNIEHLCQRQATINASIKVCYAKPFYDTFQASRLRLSLDVQHFKLG